MKGRYSKKWWRGLKKWERRNLVGLMTARGGGPSPYLPEDCSECDACGTPKFGSYGGLCDSCYREYEALHQKADKKFLALPSAVRGDA